MELLKKKEDCCGCRACENICPKSAISMKEDMCGFLYPQIDEIKCVDCGLCLKTCAFQQGYKKRKEFSPSYGYGVRHKDIEILMKSRSGGAFTALSDYILESGGVIYGAGFEPNSRFSSIVHKRAQTKEERNEFRGSKYVQSNLNDTFKRAKNDLEDGRKVLFSGTGCQIGALHSYLPKEYDNLITVDIVCHGTPSPKMWKDFLKIKEKEKHGKVTKVDFRDKVKFGWKAHRETITINGTELSSRVYTKLFYLDTALRPSCFKCIYANKERPGDITIADFWGHEKALPEYCKDDKGISLVLVNTKQGMDLWENIRDRVEFKDCTGYPYRHINMKHPTKKPENCEGFWNDYNMHGFEYVLGKYAGYKVEKKNDWKSKIKRIFS